MAHNEIYSTTKGDQKKTVERSRVIITTNTGRYQVDSHSSVYIQVFGRWAGAESGGSPSSLFRSDEYEGPKSLFRHYLIGPDAAQDAEQRHLLSRPSSAVVLEERTRNLGHGAGENKGDHLTQ